MPNLLPTLFQANALGPADPANFTGRVRVGFVVGTADTTLHLYEVHFDAGARTHWHSHSGEQILMCLSGPCAVQVRGEAPRLLREREAFRVPPGVVHWHGAMKSAASHLAVNIASTTTWLEDVSTADYRASVDALAS